MSLFAARRSHRSASFELLQVTLALGALACSDPGEPQNAGSGGAGSGGTQSASGGSLSGGGQGPGTGGSSSGAGGSSSGSGGSGSVGSGGTLGGSGSGAGGSAGSGGSLPDDRSPEGVCARWNADHQNLSEGTWSGSIENCDPGDVSAEGRENALRLLNLYRWLADLPPVTTDPERNRLAQACALMMDANDMLSHDPPESWKCWSEDGHRGAETSNISGGPGVSSVARYLLDAGGTNEMQHGHRRIILGNSFGPVGLGSTGPGGASCMQNNDGTGNAGKEWVAWPPPGVFPIEAYAPGGNRDLGDTGWSVQSERINFNGVQATVTSNGSPLEVEVSNLQGTYGGTRGIRIVPSGWDVEPGQSYAVSLTGITPEISYEFQIVACE